MQKSCGIGRNGIAPERGGEWKSVRKKSGTNDRLNVLSNVRFASFILRAIDYLASSISDYRALELARASIYLFVCYKNNNHWSKRKSKKDTVHRIHFHSFLCMNSDFLDLLILVSRCCILLLIRPISARRCCFRIHFLLREKAFFFLEIA